MTARDEAFVAMCGAVSVKVNSIASFDYGHALDAIPNDVLVRLAIERGVLKEADTWDIAEADTWDIADSVPLYRVVES